MAHQTGAWRPRIWSGLRSTPRSSPRRWSPPMPADAPGLIKLIDLGLRGVGLRQSYRRVAKQAPIRIGRYRMRISSSAREPRFLRTRLPADPRHQRKIPAPRLPQPLPPAARCCPALVLTRSTSSAATRVCAPRARGRVHRQGRRGAPTGLAALGARSPLRSPTRRAVCAASPRPAGTVRPGIPSPPPSPALAA